MTFQRALLWAILTLVAGGALIVFVIHQEFWT